MGRALCNARAARHGYHARMPEFNDSQLWRISAFERARAASPADTGDQPTLLSTTLLADLRKLRHHGAAGDDVLAVVAACLRLREAALLHLGCGPLLWPVTLFPAQGLYHAPRAPSDPGPAEALGRLELLDIERPGLRPPGHHQHERIGRAEHYRDLPPLLWALALSGPRHALLDEVPADARFRLAAGPALGAAPLSGALRPAVERLRGTAASLREIGGWPGMSPERAGRLLNGLYLTGNLMVLRSAQAHAREPGASRWSQLTRRR